MLSESLNPFTTTQLDSSQISPTSYQTSTNTGKLLEIDAGPLGDVLNYLPKYSLGRYAPTCRLFNQLIENRTHLCDVKRNAQRIHIFLENYSKLLRQDYCNCDLDSKWDDALFGRKKIISIVPVLKLFDPDETTTTWNIDSAEKQLPSNQQIEQDKLLNSFQLEVQHVYRPNIMLEWLDRLGPVIYTFGVIVAFIAAGITKIIADDISIADYIMKKLISITSVLRHQLVRESTFKIHSIALRNLTVDQIAGDHEDNRPQLMATFKNGEAKDFIRACIMYYNKVLLNTPPNVDEHRLIENDMILPTRLANNINISNTFNELCNNLFELKQELLAKIALADEKLKASQNSAQSAITENEFNEDDMNDDLNPNSRITSKLKLLKAQLESDTIPFEDLKNISNYLEKFIA